MRSITSRQGGNARQPIVADDTLAREVAQQSWRCYVWCLMDNHYHLLIEAPGGNLVRGMRHLNQVYTQAFNRRHGRVGHVLQGRYKSILVEKESHLLELCRYVVLNPRRARMVRCVRDWRWSSDRATAGYLQVPEWLAAHWVLAQFGPARESAQSAYRQFVREGLTAPSPWEAVHGQIDQWGQSRLAIDVQIILFVGRESFPAFLSARDCRPTPKSFSVRL